MWKGNRNDQRLAMKKILLLSVLSLVVIFSKAQLLSWSPSFPVENDAAKNVVITADATKGSQGLLNYSPVTDVYVHIGVITNLSTSFNRLEVCKISLGELQMHRHNVLSLGNNKWQYTITGSLRVFFGITNGAEHILKIAILFRNGNGSNKLANADGSDMYHSYLH